MEITGKIIIELPERGGVSSRTGAEWRLKSFVLETIEQYPKKMMFEVFGADRIASMNLQVGETYTVSVDVDAHEYNGRWYNTIRAFRAVPATPGSMPMGAAPVAAPAASSPAVAADPFGAPAATDAPADDLPF